MKFAKIKLQTHKMRCRQLLKKHIYTEQVEKHSYTLGREYVYFSEFQNLVGASGFEHCFPETFLYT